MSERLDSTHAGEELLAALELAECFPLRIRRKNIAANFGTIILESRIKRGLDPIDKELTAMKPDEPDNS